MAEQTVPLEVAGNAPVATNAVTANTTAAAPAANTKAAAPSNVNAKAPKTSWDLAKWFSMAGVILVESGAGFGTGFTLAKNKVEGVTPAIIVMSIVYGLEFWIRYNNGISVPLLGGGVLFLILAGLIPYLSMTRAPKSKGKAAAVYLPTVAASWSAMALLFGLVCARMSGGAVLVSDAIQGVILSLLYAGVTSALGYNVGTPGAAKSGNTTLALMAWGALVLFDLAGLARGP